MRTLSGQPGGGGITTAFEGFAYRSVAGSIDRRCLRLELSEQVAQLVQNPGGTVIRSGKDVLIELPNVRKTLAAAAIEIHDGQPILLAVNYRPEGEWQSLDRAGGTEVIYMEEEQEQIRRKRSRRCCWPTRSQSRPEPVVAEGQVPAVDLLPPVELPNTEEMKQLLQTILVRVITGPEFAECERSVGTPGEKKFALINGPLLAWPKSFRPEIKGYSLQEIDPDECLSFKRRLPGIGIVRYKRSIAPDGGVRVHVQLTIDNAGGIANGRDNMKQGANVNCWGRHAGKGWVIESFFNDLIIQPVGSE